MLSTNTHHTISNFMPLKTKTGETISLLFMCFLAAMEKINSSCQYGDFHSRKSSLFPVSLRNGLYLKIIYKVTTILGCRGIKALFLGKCCHVCPFTYFLMLCVYQEREIYATKEHAETATEADQWRCKWKAVRLTPLRAKLGYRIP